MKSELTLTPYQKEVLRSSSLTLKKLSKSATIKEHVEGILNAKVNGFKTIDIVAAKAIENAMENGTVRDLLDLQKLLGEDKKDVVDSGKFIDAIIVEGAIDVSGEARGEVKQLEESHEG